jgi:hypothetical protein
MKKLIALALLAVFGLAHASDWQIVGVAPGSSLSIDRSTLKHDGTHVLVWMQTYTQTPELIGGKQYDTWQVRANINCADDTIVMSTTVWSLKGETVFSSETPTSTTIKPDSSGSLVEQAVCPAAK